MMVAWAGMASSSYVGGRLFDATLSYNLSFILEGVAGALNLMVLALLSFRQRTVLPRSIGSQSYAETDPTIRSLNLQRSAGTVRPMSRNISMVSSLKQTGD
jgi:hypothetical protein